MGLVALAIIVDVEVAGPPSLGSEARALGFVGVFFRILSKKAFISLNSKQLSCGP